MEVIGEAVLSAALDSIFGVLTSQEFLKFASKQQVDKELKKWESNLLQIRAVLDDAEEKQVTNRAVKHWLTKLRDLAYDADDILDEFHTEALQSKLKCAESEASTSTIRKLLPTCCAALKPSGIRRNMEMASKLEGITARLEEIVNEKGRLELGTMAGGRSSKVVNKRMPTTSLIKEPKVYGREKDKEAIAELLMRDEPNNSPYSVIPIIGMGGVGKTTLAQLVYEEMVEFDCKAWVCVSDDFGIVKITKAILEHWGSCEDKNLNVLQEDLKKKLLGKKFFIVLDDVWNENYESWTALRSPFAAGAPGSKIIVTTRNQVLSSQMGSVPGHELKELSNDDCMSLFAQHALGAENFDANPDLKEIGQQIILRCKGLPLAAKTLGGVLRGRKNVKEWEVILDSKMWDLPQEHCGILPALKLSYHYLPSHLKQCFCFCPIFPKDYEFEKNELVLLWMAEGFLQQTRGSKQAQDLGHDHFNDLLSRSFFQQSSRNNSRYVMHDLINDLAQFVSEGVCFHFDDKEIAGESYTNVRHSTLIAHDFFTWQRFKVFTEMKNLRTFLALPKEYFGSCISRKVLDDLVQTLKCLRALSVPNYSIKELPDSIGTLKQLRYLNLSKNPIQKLPPSSTGLFNLQILLLCGCRELVELPIDIGNLINLQCIDISETYNLQLMPSQISQLKNLCSLSKFVVGEGSTGLTIRGLSNLPHLQGKLHVGGLHNVSNPQDTKRAHLKEKQSLRELSLKWSHSYDDLRNGRNEEEVLYLLQPHQSLEKLSVSSYGGTILPQWVADPCFTKMVELQLHDCRKITSISSIWKLPILQYLSIQGMNEVKQVVAEGIPALETLEIGHMPVWEHWSWSLGHDGNARDEFPKLKKLTLRNCPKLNGKFPRCLPSLKELDVSGCQEVVLRSLGDLPSLTAFTISSISGIESLQGTVPVQALVALEDLNVRWCIELRYLWKDGNYPNKVANLKKLDISNCHRLVSLVEGEEELLPCNLQVLTIFSCSYLEKVPNGLPSLTSLRELKINGSPKLVSFPEGAGLPYSLKRLEIGNCGSLESLPYGMMSAGHDSSNQCLLEELEIYDCESLKSFPEGKLPTKLKRLEIRDCINLESLPRGITYTDPEEMSHSNLKNLEIYKCSSLRSFPVGVFPLSLRALEIKDLKIQLLCPSSHSLSHLTILTIYNCHELESLPEGVMPNLIYLWIDDCEKLKSIANFIGNLTSLETLGIFNCSSLVSFIASGLPPNLCTLSTAGCENLRQPMSEWGLHTLTSLEILNIGFQSAFCTTKDADYFPDDCGLLLPTSITSLTISSHENLKSISRAIQHLTSLERLSINDCPKLQFLPNEGFPATLGYLSLRGCPLLTERCKKDGGDYWSIVAHIPYVNIS